MSAIVFPGLVIDLTWRDSAALPVGVAVDAYSAACAHWGERRPPSVAGINRLSALAERVIDSASASALPLFAASRAWPRPEGGGARAAAPGRAAGVAGAGLLAARWTAAEEDTNLTFADLLGVLRDAEQDELGTLISQAETASRPQPFSHIPAV